MEMALEVASWICLGLGAFFCVVGGLGLLRFPDCFSRIHAGGVTDTLGAGLVTLGLLFQVEGGFTLISVKLILILGFLLLTSAITGHAVIKAAFADGLKPKLGAELREADPVDTSASAPRAEVGSSE